MRIDDFLFHQSAAKSGKSTQSASRDIFAQLVDGKVKQAQKTIQSNPETAELYKKLSEKYDVRNAAFDEISSMSNALYGAGEITMQEHMRLTFDFGKAAEDLKRYAPNAVPSDFTMYETPADTFGKRDWIAEFSARSKSSFGSGDLIGYQLNSKVLAILQKAARENE